MLDVLRRSTRYLPRGEVEIFLLEGLIDDAIAAVKDTYSIELEGQVADAAIESRPTG